MYPRCCQFSEDRQEPSAGLMGLRGPHLPASRSATDKLGDTARAEKWRNPGGKKGSTPSRRELFGAPWKGEGPLPLMGVAPQLQPLLRGCSFVAPPYIYPKELARDMREFFNSLLGNANKPRQRHRVERSVNFGIVVEVDKHIAPL